MLCTATSSSSTSISSMSTGGGINGGWTRGDENDNTNGGNNTDKASFSTRAFSGPHAFCISIIIDHVRPCSATSLPSSQALIIQISFRFFWGDVYLYDVLLCTYVWLSNVTSHQVVYKNWEGVDPNIRRTRSPLPPYLRHPKLSYCFQSEQASFRFSAKSIMN
uniref:Uncharacterized protein n=1 Tax=Oryza rufipogon TaxID=4529 RepID=A0A0E0N7X8_ORYRU